MNLPPHHGYIRIGTASNVMPLAPPRPTAPDPARRSQILARLRAPELERPHGRHQDRRRPLDPDPRGPRRVDPLARRAARTGSSESLEARHRGRLALRRLFPNPTSRNPDRRWIANTLREEWNRAAEEVGVEVRMYEGTKHSFATDAVRRGVGMEMVQKYLGDLDRRSTECYAKLADAGLLNVLRPEHIKHG